MISFGRDGCFAEIRFYKEYTKVNYNRLHGRDVWGIARDSSGDMDPKRRSTDPGCIPPI